MVGVADLYVHGMSNDVKDSDKEGEVRGNRGMTEL